MKKKKLRVVVLGDEKVGKTHFISALRSDKPPLRGQKTIQPAVIPPEICSKSLNSMTVVFDTSTLPSDESNTDQEIENADCLLLMYDVNNTDIINRVRIHWVPRITRLNKTAPIILLGNKIDLRGGNGLNGGGREIDKFVETLCVEFEQVECGLQCSVLMNINLIDAIYTVQRAVMFPTTPLWDFYSQSLKLDFVKALKRIFRIIDVDNDGFLNDIELRDFQKRIFDVDLAPEQIRSIKKKLIELSTNGTFTREVAQIGLNFEAFKSLNKLMIKEGKSQTCWTTLKTFDFDLNLHINEQKFTDEFNSLRIESSESIEISPLPKRYLTDLFKQYSTTTDTTIDNISMPCLDRTAIEEIFSTTRSRTPFNLKRAISLNDNKLTLESWIALWNMIFALDYKSAYRNLLYIGANLSLRDTIVIFRNERGKAKFDSRKSVFQCFFFGSPKCGKTSFLESVIGNKFQNMMATTNSERSIVTIQKNKSGSLKYLIITEFPEIEVEQILNNTERLKKCDIACLLYENKEDSINYIREVQKQLPKCMPRIQVNTKSDQKPLSHINDKLYEFGVKDQFGIKQFTEVSAKHGDIHVLIDTIMHVATKPRLGINEEVYRRACGNQSKNKKSRGITTRKVLTATAIALSLSALLYLGSRKIVRTKAKQITNSIVNKITSII